MRQIVVAISSAIDASALPTTWSVIGSTRVLIATVTLQHERLYGVKDEAGSPVEIRAVRLAALGVAAATRSFRLDGANAAAARSSRKIHIGGGGVDAPIRTRSSFGDTPEPGPLLVDEYDTTVVVPPGWSARRDAGTGTLVLERDGGN